MKTFLLFIFFCSQITFSYGAKAPKLVDLVKKAGELTGKGYIYNRKLKGKVLSSGLIELTKENADAILSSALYINGYIRVPIDDTSYKIIKAREVKYTPLPTVLASFNSPPKLPDNDDFYMMEYRLKNYQALKASEKSLKKFLSKYGKIIRLKASTSLMIKDSARNLSKIYETLLTFDIEPSEDFKKELKDKEKKDFELELEERKACLQYIKELKSLKGQLNRAPVK